MLESGEGLTRAVPVFEGSPPKIILLPVLITSTARPDSVLFLVCAYRRFSVLLSSGQKATRPRISGKQFLEEAPRLGVPDVDAATSLVRMVPEPSMGRDDAPAVERESGGL